MTPLIPTAGTAEALGWALLHFVWQGAVIGIVLKLVLLVLRRASPQARYLASCAGLGLLCLCPLLTYSVKRGFVGTGLHAENPPAELKRAQTGKAGPELRTPDVVFRFTVRRNFSAVELANWLEARLSTVLLLWAAGVVLRSLRLTAGGWQLRRLRRLAEPVADPEWQVRLRRACERLGVARPVVLARSALVQVPATLGWLRPLVLLPCSGLSGLTPTQLEAILAHELAHIRRHDYAVNLFQSVVEALLFYHPVVWWVSGQIRAEREHCCDDLVVSAYGDRIGYARALTALEELRSASFGELVLAADGGLLLRRVERLLGRRIARRAPAGWLAVLAVVLLLSGWWLTERTSTMAAPAVPELSRTSSIQATTNTAIPQVLIEVKFTEVSAANMDTVLARHWTEAKAEPNFAATPLMVTNRSGVVVRPAQDKAGNLVGSIFEADDLKRHQQVQAGMARSLSPARFKSLIQTLQQRFGADVLACPRVTTLSGLQARVEVVEVKTFVTDVNVSKKRSEDAKAVYATTTIPFGPSVDLLAAASADLKTIRLTVRPSFAEFLGYDDPLGFPPQGDENDPAHISVVRPLPHFRVRQSAATLTVADGDTMVMDGFGVLEGPPRRAPANAQVFPAAPPEKKHLLVFVTPVLMDSKGHRLHPE